MKTIQSIFRKTNSRDSIPYQYYSHLYKLVQKLHFAATIFPLEEICVPPVILAPYPSQYSGRNILYEDIAQQIVPEMSDFPHLATLLGAPTISLIDAISGGTNLLLIGDIGSGKTTALCDLIIDIIKNRNQNGDTKRTLPIYIHAACLDLSDDYSGKFLEPIKKALLHQFPLELHRSIPTLLKKFFENKRILLLVDGLDEFPPTLFNQVVDYLDTVTSKFPGIQIVVTSSPYYFGKLTRLGFIPITMGLWNKKKQRDFVEKWVNAWEKSNTSQSKLEPQIDFALMLEWLTSGAPIISPLEMTLKTWGAFLGDTNCDTYPDLINSYLRRFLNGNNSARNSLEKIAIQIVNKSTPIMKIGEIDEWYFYQDNQYNLFRVRQDRDNNSVEEEILFSIFPKNSDHHLSALIETGLLWSPSNGNISIIHPVITAFLAACCILKIKQKITGDIDIPIAELGCWNTKIFTQKMYVDLYDDKGFLERLLEKNNQPLNRELIIIGSFAENSSTSCTWRSIILKKLASLFLETQVDLRTKFKILTNILVSNQDGVNIFIKRLISSSHADNRLFGALGCGYLGNREQIEFLSNLLNDPILNVQRAASLALISTNNLKAIDILTTSLLRGNETQKRNAAEALANNLIQGLQALEKSIQHEDILVRRAVIHGLQRIRNEKSIQLLKNIQFNETQWIVKDAAASALEWLTNKNPFIPIPASDPANIPWLISFAAQRGEGLSPGKKPINLMLLALQEGLDEQKLAALEYLKYNGDASIATWIKEIYQNAEKLVKMAAFETLEYLSLQGIEI